MQEKEKTIDANNEDKHSRLLSIQLNTSLETLKINNNIDAYLPSFLSLEQIISQYKSAHSVRGERLSHYTRCQVLPALLNPESSLRLYNAQYLNDPEEGALLLNKLLPKIKDVQGMNLFLTLLYERYRCINDQKSSVYIASFCENSDLLPMWSMYGDNGRGVSLTVSPDNSFNIRQRNSETGRIPEQKLIFQKVHYVDLESKISVLDSLSQSITNALLSYANELQTLEMEGEICAEDFRLVVDRAIDIATSLIDSCRFLFKSSTYCHEKEFRLISICDCPSPKYEALDFGGDMRLYVELDKNLSYECVTIGPNCDRVAEIRQYSLHSDYVKSVKLSKIQYRS